MFHVLLRMWTQGNIKIDIDIDTIFYVVNMLSQMASLQIYLTGKIKGEIKIQMLKIWITNC